MAKAYSGAKGKAGSKKPIRRVVPSWTRYGAKEVEMLVLKLNKIIYNIIIEQIFLVLEFKKIFLNDNFCLLKNNTININNSTNNNNTMLLLNQSIIVNNQSDINCLWFDIYLKFAFFIHT
jgi:hypothetical protein